jgi:hypothetical protein
MGIRAWLAGTEFTFLSRLGAAGGTTNRQHFRFCGLHPYIMQLCAGAGWSLLTRRFPGTADPPTQALLIALLVHADSVANASANTSAPRAMSSGDAYSSGRWLYPLRHGINNIATGAMRDMKSES